MLEAINIFTKGGMILFSWSLSFASLKGNPVEALIRTCLLEERSGETSFTYASGSTAYTLKWTFHNELGLVFVAVYQKILQLAYVDELLESVKCGFTGRYKPRQMEYPEFEDEFQRLLKSAEQRAEADRRPKAAPKAFDKAKKAAKRNDASGKVQELSEESSGAALSSTDNLSKLGENGNGAASGGETNGDSKVAAKASTGSAFDRSKLVAKSKKGGTSSMSSKGGLSSTGSPIKKPELGGGGGDGGEENAGSVKPKKPKEKRVWADTVVKDKNLDFSEGKPPEGAAGNDDAPVDLTAKSAMDVEDEEVDYDDDDDEEEEDEVSANGASANGGSSKKNKKKRGFFSSMMNSSLVRSVVGKQSLEREDLQPVLDQLKNNFMNKNVAEDIAERLCDSVAVSLMGKKLATFTSLKGMVRAAMEEALTRILTPKRSTDILRDVQVAKESGRPYTIVFVGVNGVGKSTNLSKVAYWLLQHDVSVMIAACDTFRAGAVEQLRTHCKRLQVPLFERGYEKDPAAVANEAVKAATRAGTDVVLVDTAGRMQDNEPLMRALSKLININEPDLVLFVGEALVGNDAVDQLSKFNQRLSDLNSSGRTQIIDGIVLSKFDTIDDKVGAALSMVYTCGAPVMFVGCGQTYTDLRKLNVKSIVKILLS